MKDFSRAWEGGLVGKIYDYYMQGRYTESQYREELDKLRKINTDWFDVIFRKAFFTIPIFCLCAEVRRKPIIMHLLTIMASPEF